MRPWIPALLATACGPLRIAYPDPDEPVVIDSGDTAATLPPCSDEPWPDRAVEVQTVCTLPPAELTLVQKWATAHPNISGAYQVLAGRFEDADGDGTIGLADPMSLLIVPGSLTNAPEAGPVLMDGEGTVSLAVSDFGGARSCRAIIADLDSEHTGAEAMLTWSWHQGTSELGWMDESGLSARTDLGVYLYGEPWLLDLEGDGTPELAWGDAVRDPATGLPLLRLEAGDDFVLVMATDLDVDGLPELIGRTLGRAEPELIIWDARGTERARFGWPVFQALTSTTQLAVGDLDGDGQGELVASTEGQLSVLELDGSVRATIATGAGSSSLAGLAELDGDPLPEIVLDIQPTGEDEAAMVAYDTDLSELWRWESESDYWLPFAAADLDADGQHELVVRDGESLVLLAPSGALLDRIDAPGVNGGSHAPIVVDIDGDDLAEIVVASGAGWAAAFESPSGGWAVRGADRPWPQLWHHPGDRQRDGSLPPPGDAHWLRPGENVWLGLAAGAPDLPDLALELVDRCATEDGWTRYTVYLANHGPGDLEEPVTVTLARGDDDRELDRVTSPAALASGSAVALQLEADIGNDDAPLRFEVDSEGRVAQCAERSDTTTWPDGWGE